MSESVIVYPGFFDPITLGHTNIVKRATGAFDRVVIALSKDSSKDPLFTFEERHALIDSIYATNRQVSVETFEGLLVHYLEKKSYRTVLRGLRTVSDFEYEFQMALANKTMNAEIETFFMMTDSKYSFISSTLIKEIARLGGSVREMVPGMVCESLERKFA
ncbi:MAG: pantetheine-phosphate adenylyltransferase [Bdellovibrionota bacterium]|nr:pantetheine-phosphate adenylyltransferase [Deltaproteobacteria bacterium]